MTTLQESIPNTKHSLWRGTDKTAHMYTNFFPPFHMSIASFTRSNSRGVSVVRVSPYIPLPHGSAIKLLMFPIAVLAMWSSKAVFSRVLLKHSSTSSQSIFAFLALFCPIFTVSWVLRLRGLPNFRDALLVFCNRQRGRKHHMWQNAVKWKGKNTCLVIQQNWGCNLEQFHFIEQTCYS